MHNSLEPTCTFLVQASSHLGLLDALETHEDHVLISVWEKQSLRCGGILPQNLSAYA